MKSRFELPLFCVAALAALAIASPALADANAKTSASARGTVAYADNPPLPEFRVKTTDLNLATVEGRATLDQRLGTAINLACEPADNRDLRRQMEIGKCTLKARIAIEPRRAALIAAATSHGDQFAAR